jgi:purine-binding chemotaxis protein CheW
VALRDATRNTAVIARVGERRCAIPIAHVVETLRPAAVEPLAGAPPSVLGTATIRGELVPVVDLARLLGVTGGEPTRFVTIDADGRRVALAVDEVLGVRDLDGGGDDLPPLLHDADVHEVATLGRLDGALVLVLQAARLVPPEVPPRVANVPDPVSTS